MVQQIFPVDWQHISPSLPWQLEEKHHVSTTHFCCCHPARAKASATKSLP
jgi:hypothetical protein